MGQKKCNFWKKNFFYSVFSCSAMRGHLLDSTMAQKQKYLSSPSSIFSFSNGQWIYKSCPIWVSWKAQPRNKDKWTTNCQFYWVRHSTALQPLTFLKKKNKKETSVLLSVRSLNVPVNIPGFCHRKVKINFCVRENCGFFFFKHHKVFGSRYAEEGTHRHRETLTTGINSVLLHRWCSCNAFVIDGCGIKQRSISKYTADLL